MSEQKDPQSEEIKKLVIARLKAIPSDKKISIGKDGDFSTEELIDCVKKNDAVGRKIIEVQMDFLQSLKKGDFLDE